MQDCRLEFTSIHTNSHRFSSSQFTSWNADSRESQCELENSQCELGFTVWTGVQEVNWVHSVNPNINEWQYGNYSWFRRRQHNSNTVLGLGLAGKQLQCAFLKETCPTGPSWDWPEQCRDCKSWFSKFYTTSARILRNLDAADIYLDFYVFDMIWEYIFQLFRVSFEHLSSRFCRFGGGVFAVSGCSKYLVFVIRDFRSSTQRQPESFGFSMQQISM